MHTARSNTYTNIITYINTLGCCGCTEFHAKGEIQINMHFARVQHNSLGLFEGNSNLQTKIHMGTSFCE